MKAHLDRISSPYYVAQAETIGELINEVERFMAEGWKPLGGIAVVSPSDKRNGSYIQAVVRVDRPAIHK